MYIQKQSKSSYRVCEDDIERLCSALIEQGFVNEPAPGAVVARLRRGGAVLLFYRSRAVVAQGRDLGAAVRAVEEVATCQTK